MQSVEGAEGEDLRDHIFAMIRSDCEGMRGLCRGIGLSGRMGFKRIENALSDSPKDKLISGSRN